MNKHVHTTIIITQHKGDIIWQNFFTWYDSEQIDEKPNCCLKRGHAVLKNCSPPGRPRSCWLCKKSRGRFQLVMLHFLTAVWMRFVPMMAVVGGLSMKGEITILAGQVFFVVSSWSNCRVLSFSEKFVCLYSITQMLHVWNIYQHLP